MEKQLLTP